MLSLAPLKDLSVIIPVAPGESSWHHLWLDLQMLPPDCEILFSGPEPIRIDGGASGSVPAYRWVESRPGRATQLNVGARSATRPFLWFVHADSRFNWAAPQTIARMLASGARDSRALHYFDLRFAGDGPSLMPLNALGANLRSRLLGMPFGDQGFLLSRELFEELGGFDENAPYGEDHLFVWQARRKGVALRRFPAELRTSARKYERRGWTRTTLKHWELTARQAAPECAKLVWERLRSRSCSGSFTR